jgi:bifunctional DNA-binding transcriptional regulator/antitoxin component of YhaV-PrlF toxin-antitoxin module
MSSKPMTITLTNEIQRMLPPGVRRKAGFKAGDKVEVKAIGGIVTLIGKPAVADDKDEYTAEERREIDAGIAESQEEFKQGLGFGPFETHEEFISSLHKEAKKLRSGASKKSKRQLK